MAKMTLRDIPIQGKTILLRADFNVPLDATQHITDDTRIRATLPTLEFILGKGVKRLILASHLGRPDGKPNAKYSMKPVAGRLKELLGRDVLFLNDCVGDSVKKELAGSPVQVVLLENLRFHAEEEANDPAFAKEQLVLMLREWYMHPNGQIPAYEWAFGDVNPPVLAR